MNILTNSMERLTKMLTLTDAKLKEMGKEPYGIRELTPREQKEKFDNLTPGELWKMIDEQGPDEVNEWLSKFMPKEENYG